MKGIIRQIGREGETKRNKERDEPGMNRREGGVRIRIAYCNLTTVHAKLFTRADTYPELSHHRSASPASTAIVQIRQGCTPPIGCSLTVPVCPCLHLLTCTHACLYILT